MAKRAPVGRLLLFGGAFDPPHNGHIHLLQGAMALTKPDRVIVMPTGRSPHKAAGRTPGWLRWEMCRRCFAPLDKRVHISWDELLRPGPSYTLDTVRRLRRRFPAARIFLCVGGDMLRTFTGWHEWRRLLEMVTLCVQYRTPDEAAALRAAREELTAAGAKLLEGPAQVVEISSTQLRAAAAAGQPLQGLTPPAVQALIRRFGLYRRPLSRRHIAAQVRRGLGRARWRHTQGVRRTARRLARRFGVDRRQADLAALLHDFLKESSKTQLLQIFADNVIMDAAPTAPAGQWHSALTAPGAPGVPDHPADVTAPLRARTPAAWHGICAALEARRRFGVRDAQVLSAIECHTTGKAGMSRLDMVIYLADMISPERRWPGVRQLRRLCRSAGLSEAMRWALQHTLEHVRAQGGSVDACSVQALRDIEDRLAKGDE